jgi:PKD repeat protein
MTEQPHSAWRRMLALPASTILILSISLMLALILALGTAPFQGQTPIALACGLANTPTMIANNYPAIPTPVTPTSDPNQPVGFFPGDYYSNQGITFTEDLSAVPNAPPKESIQWRWDFGDGSALASGATPAHTYQHSGSFAVKVSTYDPVTKSWVDFDSATITLLAHPWDNPPIAKATADKTLVALNESVTFDASGSKALVGSQLSYKWNFGDTQEADGPHVTHTFTIPGNAQVTLIVTDSRGARSTAVVPVQVAQSIPQVRLQASSAAAQVGQEITFSTTLVQLQPGDKITKYIWDFGDQTPQQTTTSNQTTHRYTKAGHYHAQVQAIDAQNVPGTAAFDITVQPAGPATGNSGSMNPYIVIGLGILVVLALGGILLSSLWRRRPAPAAQGHWSARRPTTNTRAPARVVEAAKRPPARRSSANQTQRPLQKPPVHRPAAPPPGADETFDEGFLRD